MNIQYYGVDKEIKILGDQHLMHYNHNHDALGRFTGSGSSLKRRERAAKRGLNKLYKLDKKANKHYAKSYQNYIIAKNPRQAYHRYKYDEFGRGVIGRFFIPGKSTSKRAEDYSKKLQKRIGNVPVSNLNSKQLYAGRKYSLKFVY